jgi:hypothetical protein
LYFNLSRLRLYFGGLFLLQIVACIGHLPYARAGEVDFRTFYTAGHMVHSSQLYDYAAEVAAQNTWVSPNQYALPFMFPAYVALLFALLSYVNYQAAYWIFFVLNLCLCAGAVLVMRPYLGALHARWRLLIPMLFLSFMPLGTAVAFGQVSVLLLFLYCSCFAAIESEMPFLAGLLLSLALIKFQIALPIALLFLAWRQWRFLAGFLAGAAALTLISVHTTGWPVFTHYLRSLVFMSGQTASETKYAMFSAQMPNLYGFFHTLCPGLSGYILTGFCSLAVMVWAATRRPSLSLALLAGMLVSYHLYVYDLTLLLLPVSLILNAELEGGTNRPALYASVFMVTSPLLRFMIPTSFNFLFAIPVATLFLFLDRVGESGAASILQLQLKPVKAFAGASKI